MENIVIPVEIKEKAYTIFQDCLFKATEKIKREYYHLPIAEQPITIYREGLLL